MQHSELQQIMRDGHIYATRIGAYGDDPKLAIYDKVVEEAKELGVAFSMDLEPDLESYKADIPRIGEKKSFEKWIKSTDADELADVIITCLSGAHKLGIDIEEHIRLKQAYNQTR